MKRKKNRFLKSGQLKEEMALQITSMADIFTIILVFLLKSFSTGVSNISPNNIVLPESHSQDEIVDMLKIEISPSAILLDDRPVTLLSEFSLAQGDVEENGTARSLNTALISHHEIERQSSNTQTTVIQEEEMADPNSPVASRVMLLADQKTPYGLIRSVLTAANNSGYSEFKLVFVEDR